MRIETGSILALDDAFVISVGREKLAQVDTIFSLVEAANLPADTMALQLDSDRVQILVSTNAYQNLNTLRGLKNGKAIVLNSVYLPAVMEVLNSLKDGASSYEGRRWHKVFTAKCEHFGIAIESIEPWRDAQRLLASPFAEINKSAELFGG